MCRARIFFTLVFGLSIFYAKASEIVIMGGMLFEPPVCNINNEEPMIVDFGNSVVARKVDGVNYRQKIPFARISCGSTPPEINWDLFMTLSAEGVDYDPGAIKTSTDNLAIRIMHDGQPFELGKSTRIPSKGYVILEAVPIKKTGSLLAQGTFSAVATLEVSFL